jgi:anti-sigma factor RsiW
MNPNCNDIQPLIALAVSDDLSADDRRRVDRHVEHCAACGRVYVELRELHGNLTALRELPAPMPADPALSGPPLRAAFPGMVTAVLAAVAMASVVVLRTDSGEPERTTQSEPTHTVVVAHHAEPESVPAPPPRNALDVTDKEPGISNRIVATIHTKDPDLVILWMGD